MRAFTFRLQTLQRLREQARDVAQRALAAAQEKQAVLEQQQASLQIDLQGLETHMRNTITKQHLDVDRAMDGHRHQLSLQARLAELDKAMLDARAQVERCRDKLIEADREVKILEKLHERQLAEHTRQLAQHEAKQLDEAATIRASRQ